MAKKKIAIEVDIDTSNGAKSLKELKQDISASIEELAKLDKGTEAYNNLAISIQESQKKIKDLNEDIARTSAIGKLEAVAGIGTKIAAGFSLAQGAMALFGTESKEVEKALLKVQAAQAILQGFKELEGVGDALKNAKDAITSMGQGIANYIKGLEGATAAQKIFNLIASLNPVGIIITAVAALAAGLVILAKNYQTVSDENKELRKEMELSNAVIGDQISANESLIRMLNGVYGQEKKLADLKKENLILQQQQTRASYDQAAKEYASAQMELKAFEQKAGVFDKITSIFNPFAIVKTKLTEQINSIVNPFTIVKAKLAEQVAASGREMIKLANQNKSILEQQINQRLLEKLHEPPNAVFRKKDLTDAQMYHVEMNSINVEADKKEQGLRKSTINWEQLMEEKQREQDEYYAQKKRERDERNKQFAIASTQQGLQTIQDLTTAFAGKSEEAQRRAFNINKAAQLAEATISSILASQKAFTSQLVAGDPTSPIRATIAAALVAAAGVARIAAIARTQFDSNSEGGASAGLSGGFSGNGATFTPSLNNSLGNTSTTLSNLNNNQGQNNDPIKVYVTETDISNSINQVNKIKSKALIE
jgi:hypothetical protein